MKITTLDKTVQKTLNDAFYNIPRFQRPYSWGREHVEDFWRDCMSNRDADYFIGSMVVFKDGSLLQVVDGQQRLTTITMVLCAIRDALLDNKSTDLAAGIHGLIERTDLENKTRYVLKTETSYPYLQEYIQKMGKPATEPQGSSEEENLKAAYTGIRDFLSAEITTTLDKAGAAAQANRKDVVETELKRIRDRFLGLHSIVIELDNEEDAYIIFETLNTRGQDLRVSDLVKNQLSKLLRTENRDVDLFRDKWKKVVSVIDHAEAELDINSFLLHFWLSRNEYVTEQTLFKAFKWAVKSAAQGQTILDALVADAAEYRTIAEPDYKAWDKQDIPICESLRALGLFKVKQPMPCLLAGMSEYAAGRIRRKDLAQLLELLEHYHFSSTAIASMRSSGGVSRMYANYGKGLREATDAAARVKLIGELAEKLRKRSPAYPIFEAEYADLKCSTEFSKDKKLVSYILKKMDASLRQGVPINYEKMTIEHLAPQSEAGISLTAEEVASIGNLLLVPSELNDKLANKAFTEKKKLILAAGQPLDAYLQSANQWTGKEIGERSRAMAKISYETIWRI